MKTSQSILSLGCLGSGKALSKSDNFNPSDLIACIPVLTVRNPLAWLNRFSNLGIIAFACRTDQDTTSYICSTKNSGLSIIIRSPKSNQGSTWEAIQKHGSHFSELLFFCSSDIALNMASDICLETLKIPDRIFETTAYSKSCRLDVYEGVTYSFIFQNYDSLFLEGYIPYENKFKIEDPLLDIKLDHIVQNAPRELYINFCDFFIKLGFVATFDGSDSVEFRTTAFSPPGGIFDKIPFFAMNSSDNPDSQINVGIQQYGGPFIQHLAIHVNNWCHGAEAMQKASIPLMGKQRRHLMGTYYEEAKPLFERVFPDNNYNKFSELGGLFDEDCVGEGKKLGLQQAFFNTIDSIDLNDTGRLTCFLELIQRSAHELTESELKEMDRLKGACAGFGQRNFRHLAADVTHHGHEIGIVTNLRE